jgi:hypothetical protein
MQAGSQSFIQPTTFSQQRTVTPLTVWEKIDCLNQLMKEDAMQKPRYFYLAMLLFFFLGMSLLANAQTGRGHPKSSPNYNTATEITVKGTVEAVNQQTSPKGWGGTHIILKTEKETFDVHVGPSWYLTQNNFSFAKGDQIEVTGSKVKFGNTDAVLAREIKKGDKSLTLRNAQGVPAWSRGRARKAS